MRRDDKKINIWILLIDTSFLRNRVESIDATWDPLEKICQSYQVTGDYKVGQ